MKLIRLACLAAALGVVALPALVRADDVKDLKAQARALVEKSHKAVITAKLVLKISTARGEREAKVETTGTVIDASGLTVVPASAVDPAAMMGGGGAARGGRRGGGGGGGAGGGAMGGAGDVKIDVTETTLVLEDGTEVESDVVLKDNELDLAFIRPRDPATKLDCVTLKSRGTPPGLLDDVIVVGRLDKVANRATAVSIGTIKAVVKGPRTYYICDDELSRNSTGCVAYGADGSTLGVFVTKVSAGEDGRRGGAAIVIRSVEDVLEIATQAKAAKAPEKKKDEEKSAKADGKDSKDDKKDEPKKDDKKPAKKDEDD